MTNATPPEVPRIEMHHDVRDLLDEVFPPVEEGIRYQQMRALERGDRLKNLWRRIVEQTLWTLAKNGLIRSPEDSAVIEKAKALVAQLDTFGIDDLTGEEVELQDAVHALPSGESDSTSS